jgi:hypothetical protein
MQKIKHFSLPSSRPLLILLLAMTSGSLAIISCEKTAENDVLTKNGIPMTAAAEIQTPAVVSPATGTVDVSYNRSTRKLTYTVNWRNLTDSITGSHIHGVASKTQNAPVVHPFTIPVAARTTVTGTYSGEAEVDGIKIKEDSLLAGFYYFNIHTNRYKGGEIRGQIEF